jgi:serine protease Do
MNREPLDEAAQEFYRLPDSNGVIISDVQEGGPGAQAGLRSGDVIRKVDGQIVADNYDLVSKIASHQPGERVALQVYRRAANGRPASTIELSVQLADRDEGISTAQQRGERRRPEPERESYAAEGLGVTVEALTPELRGELNLTSEQRGVVVTDVEFGSEAAARGIQPGMVIIAVNDEPVESVSDWRQALDDLDGGSSAKVDVLANQQTTFFFLRIPRD